MDYAERQVKFWSFIGPLMVLFILAVTMVRFSPQEIILPLAAIFGTLACSQWKMKGLILSLSALLILLIFNFNAAPVSEYYWIIGIFMAVSLGLIVTTLSYEEVEEMVLKLKKDLQRQMTSSNQLEDKYLTVSEEWKKEKEQLLADLEWRKEVDKEREEIYKKALEKSALIKKEIQTLRDKKEEHLKEIAALKAQVSKHEENSHRHHEVVKQIEQKYEELLEKMRARLEENQPEKKNTEAHPNFEAMYHQLRKQFEEKQNVLDQTRKELFTSNEEALASNKEGSESLLRAESEYLQRETELRAQLEKQEQEYEEEISSLHELISLISGSTA